MTEPPRTPGSSSSVADQNDPGEDEILEEIERRALFEMPEDDEDDESIDVLRVLRDEEPSGQPGADLTLGGYIDVHNRVPAFEGSDGQPYTVDIDAEASGEGDRAWAAFLVFIRWAATGAGIMDHVESGDIAWGPTEEAARRSALDLSLYEIKSELDAAILRKHEQLED